MSSRAVKRWRGCSLSSESYERRSVVITSSLVFSEWDRILKDPSTAAAAIDRVAHHSLTIEFGRDMKSARAEGAARSNGVQFDSATAAKKIGA